METTVANTPESIRISAQLAVALLQYLNRQPMGDVRQLVMRLEQEAAESQAEHERAKQAAAAPAE